MKPIGPNHGIEAVRKNLGASEPTSALGLNRLLGEPGKVYPTEAGPVEGTVRKLVENNNELVGFVLPELDDALLDINARLRALEVAGPTTPFPGSG